ncbi:MAG: hypothetical protein HY921_10715 [Elusimicrobia bacterium]|nr:hypothetical protein [Elusimicrobiota bacterium]
MTLLFLAQPLIFALLASAEKSGITVQVYRGENAAVKGEAEEWSSGIGLFKDLVQKHCGFELPIIVPPPVRIEGLARESLLLERAAGVPYYRAALKALLRRYPAIPALRRKAEVSVIMVKNLEEHCAYAFPTVAFIEKNGAFSKAEKDALSGRVLVSLDSGLDCRNVGRQMAHELAHVFVQDEPPHQCRGPEGGMTPCPPNNLLADFWVEKNSPPPGRYGRGGGDEDGGIDDILGQNLHPATGMELTPDQCAAIKLTAAELLQK